MEATSFFILHMDSGYKVGRRYDDRASAEEAFRELTAAYPSLAHNLALVGFNAAGEMLSNETLSDLWVS